MFDQKKMRSEKVHRNKEKSPPIDKSFWLIIKKRKWSKNEVLEIENLIFVSTTDLELKKLPWFLKSAPWPQKMHLIFKNNQFSLKKFFRSKAPKSQI